MRRSRFDEPLVAITVDERRIGVCRRAGAEAWLVENLARGPATELPRGAVVFVALTEQWVLAGLLPADAPGVEVAGPAGPSEPSIGGSAWLATVPIDRSHETHVEVSFGGESKTRVVLPADERARSGKRLSPPHLGGLQLLSLDNPSSRGW
jgi:hypothetical protein